jgi:GNAT superfamily N-acetyltransferase
MDIYAALSGIILGTRTQAHEILQQDRRAADRGEYRVRLIAWDGTQATGVAALLQTPFIPEGSLELRIGVASERRRLGIGSAVLDLAAENARSQGFSGLVASVPALDDVAIAFAVRRGFRPWHDRLSLALELPHATWPVPHLESGYDIGSASDAPDDQAVIAALLSRLVSTSPDMEGLPPWDSAAAARFLFANPAIEPDWILVARRRGQPMGLAILSRLQEHAYAFFTGVEPAMRGKGLGRALKIASIETARKAGFDRLVTDNLSTNAAMLALNRSLGFRETARVHVMRFALD